MTTKSNGQEKAERQYTLNEAMNLLTEQTMNASYSMPSRARLASTFMDPRRSIDDECGYKRTEELTVEDYRKFYDREPVATRVVEIMPNECWKIQPTVYESEDSDEVTEFEDAWDALGQSLAGAGFFRSEEGSPIWDNLLRADILSGIGHYGGTLLGIDDGKPTSEPAEGIDEHGQPSKKSVAERKLLYLRPLDESCLQITRWDTDTSSPRYNKPTEYSVTTSRQLSPGLVSVSPADMQTLKVHWSRVVHLAEGDVFGIPRMRPVFNRLYDIYKVCGSSGEMYYKGAFPGWGLEMLPELILAGHIKDVDTSGVKDQIEQWQNGLQRVLFLKGLTMKNLGSQVVDPTAAVMLYIKMICVQLGIPERIFMGSERGELSSSQDKSTWNDRVAGRQQTYLTPKVIVPFVDRLILLGVLPRPEEYHVKWPDLGALTDAEKATIAVQRIDAMTKYVQGGVESLMQPMDFLTRELGYEDEEAESILETSLQAAGDKMEGDGSGDSPLLSMVGGITGITELFKAAKEGSISPDQLKQTLMLFYKLPEEKADEMIAGMQEQIDAEDAKQEEQAAQQAEAMKVAGVQPGQQVPGQPKPAKGKVPPQFQK